ncbi:hypothetical protein [Agaribacter flavus]|uniref:DUF4129 domain-containing protein n=1 Tax=Agaribacter flavus TaxID=1902781 RepID=A0ABV7FLC6_9ALTE
MQLDKLAVSVEAKTSWQSFDLGCRVAIKHYLKLLLIWIVPALPIFIISCLINLMYGWLIFWLCKPIYERGQLYFLSHAVFASRPSFMHLLKALPSQIKPMCLSSLTIRRLAPSRSFDLAVLLLEKLTGEMRSKRLKVLHSSKDNNTAWWTICCIHWEFFIALAFLVTLNMLLPQEFSDTILFFNMDYASTTELIAQNLSMFVGAAIVAPFYVSGGFIAYLNRRVHLEAWDIELGFKKWRQQANLQESTLGKNTNSVGSKSIKALVITFCLLTFSNHGLFGQSAMAQDTSDENTLDTQNEAPKFSEAQGTKREEIKSSLTTLMEAPPFGGKETVTNYRWKRKESDAKDDSDFDFSKWAKIGATLANSLEIIMWFVFIFTFSYILYRNWQNISQFFSVPTSENPPLELPTFISSKFTDKLPTDISAAIHDAIAKGEYRFALSLLLRASLTHLSQANVRITRSMTENECLQAIKSSSSASTYAYMHRLFHAWMKMAWAHQLPDEQALRKLNTEFSALFVSSSNSDHPPLEQGVAK